MEPAQTSTEMLAELARYVIAEPYPFALDLENCQGMWLATIEGRKIFDWAGYYGSKLIGHNHPGLLEPDYVRQLVVAANNKVANPDFLTPQCLEYYRLLHEIAPVCMKNPRLEVYVVNSGAEAVENMMKYLINLHHQRMAGRITKGGGRFIYFDQAFHGRTIYALNITQLSSDPMVTKDFQGIIEGNIKIPFPYLDHSRGEPENRRRMTETLASVAWFLEQMGPEIAGIIVEPLQGAGGHRLAYPEFFRGLSELAHRHDVYLGFDEVQTAGGQTGTIFAVDQFDLPHPPQAIATAKKLGNGVMYMLNSMEDRGILDSTWGGNLSDMVRFVQEMKIVRREGLIEQVPQKSARLSAGLNDLAASFPELVYNVRGMGLYQGFSLRPPATKSVVIDRALETEDLLLLGAGTNSIRLRPSLSVTEADIDLVVEKLRRVVGEIAAAG
jgi:L-lysine 6-transaminase